MNSLLCVVVVSIFAVGATATEFCRDLPKTRHDEMKDTMKFKDAFRIVLSNENYKCFHFQYLKNRNNDPKYATGLFISYKLGVHYTRVLRINNRIDQWRANSGTDSKIPDIKFRKLFTLWKEEGYCVYACDDKGVYIKIFRCDATNKKGYAAVKRTLAELERKIGRLPFLIRPEEVWDDAECSKYSSSMPSSPLGLGNGYVVPDVHGIDDSNIGVNGKPDKNFTPSSLFYLY